MDKELIKILFALLRFEISGAELCETDKNLIKEEVLPALYKLSKKHDLAHLIGDALDKNGLLVDGSEAKKRFLQERNMAVYRYEQLQYELECICDTFEEAKISFIPLKGAVIRQYYPEPWMRTSCDIDILVEEENLQTAIAVLEEKLSYKCTEIGQHDAQIFAENGTHIELHYSLLESGSKNTVKPILDLVWKRVEQISFFCCRMSDNLFYVYIISHIAKHLKFGGCGIRPLMDLWILNHKIMHDNSEREKLLKEAGLFTLAKSLEGLSEIWFSGVKADELSIALEEYILTGGVYGSFDNKVAAQQSRKKNKFSYLISRLFLPYSQMKFKYPTLQKYPILYPFFVVKRMFFLFKKDTKKRAVSELNQTISGDEEKQKQIAKLLKDLDL